jgi:hypothetical protein
MMAAITKALGITVAGMELVEPFLRMATSLKVATTWTKGMVMVCTNGVMAVSILASSFKIIDRAEVPTRGLMVQSTKVNFKPGIVMARACTDSLMVPCIRVNGHKENITVLAR